MTLRPVLPAKPYVDLHLHSHYSDGSDSPSRVVERAQALGIHAIALTDHDTIDGLPEARAAAEAAGIAFLNGVEVSCRFEDMGVHLLAYGFNPADAPLVGMLRELSSSRADRAVRILERLAEAGIQIHREELGELEEGGALTRMHIARILRERGYVRTVQGAFDQYLNPGRPAWIPSESVPVAEAIATVHNAGGLIFVAHPHLTRRLKRRMDALLEHPFDGIEAYHSSHSREGIRVLKLLAHERDLLVSGGSDCHGLAKGKTEMGNVKTPLSYWDALQARLRENTGNREGGPSGSSDC